MFRCALLSKAALEAPWHVPCGGAPYGDSNLAFIANDWHTALLPLYLQALAQGLEQPLDMHLLPRSSMAADSPLPSSVGPGVSHEQSDAHVPGACCGGSRARQWGS
jgi:hypothetical protein